MDAALGQSIITAGAALAGVMLTVVVTGRRERRRSAEQLSREERMSRDEQERENRRLGEERWRWLREERRTVYVGFAVTVDGALSKSGDAVGELVRGNTEGASQRATDLLQLLDPVAVSLHEIQLIGATDVVNPAGRVWQLLWRQGAKLDELVNQLEAGEKIDPTEVMYGIQLLGEATRAFTSAAREDLEVDDLDEDDQPNSAHRSGSGTVEE